MPLKVTSAGVARAEVVPWEIEHSIFGVAYTLTNGQAGAVAIGTRDQAEAAVREMLAESPSVIPFNNIAAS